MASIPKNSNYLTPQNQYGASENYADRQRVFEEESQQIIKGSAERIQKISQENDPDYGALFRDLLTTFAAERQQIAKKATTPEAELFGKERTDVDQIFAYTPLIGVYKEANTLAITQLGSEMAKMKRSLRDFEETTRKGEERTEGRRFSYQIDILSPQEIQKYAQDISPEQASKARQEILKEFPQINSFELMTKVKEKYPELYKHTKMNFYITKVFDMFPRPTVDSVRKEVVSGNSANLKSDWILITKRCEIEGKMYALSQWLTWAYRNYTRDPVERMLDPQFRPAITIMHQDMFLTKNSLKECEKIFSNIMKSGFTQSSVNKLKDQVALLRYIFAETMPYIRGSAAIGEWLEGSIYKAHNLSHAYRPNYPRESVDLVAISSLKYADYLKRYHELVQCTPTN